MIFPFSFKRIRRDCGSDLAGLDGAQARPGPRISDFCAFDRHQRDRPARRALPPLALSIRSSIASCRRSSSAVATGTTQRRRPGRTSARTVCRAVRRARPTARVERQRALPARHREIDVGEDPRVEQRAVQLAVRVVDLVALAQRVEAVALAGMHLARERERIEHAAQRRDACAHSPRQPRELGVQEGDVEGGVVDDELGARR